VHSVEEAGVRPTIGRIEAERSVISRAGRLFEPAGVALRLNTARYSRRLAVSHRYPRSATENLRVATKTPSHKE